MKKAARKKFGLMDQHEITRLKTRSGAGAHRPKGERVGNKGALRKRLMEEAW